VNRAYLSAEDVAQALLDAGVEITPETALACRFGKAADQLTKKLHQQVCCELADFAEEGLK
jgi:hypothetical protein